MTQLLRQSVGAIAYRRMTPEVVANIADKVLEGHSLVSAAACLGLSRRTVTYWLARGRDAIELMGDGDPPEADKLYVELYFRVYRAEAECAGSAVAAIKQAWLDGDWKAAAWWLERRRNDEYGAKATVQVEAAAKTLDREALKALLLEKLREMETEGETTVEVLPDRSPSSETTTPETPKAGELAKNSGPTGGKP